MFIDLQENYATQFHLLTEITCPVDALAQNKILTSSILLFIVSKLKNVSMMILLPTQFLFRCRGEGVINKISFIMYSEV